MVWVCLLCSVVVVREHPEKWCEIFHNRRIECFANAILTRPVSRMFIIWSQMNGVASFRFWIFLISVLAVIFPAQLCRAQLATEFVAGGKSLTIEAEGIQQWRSDFCAKVIIGDQEVELRSTMGKLVHTAAAVETEPTPLGAATITVRTVHFAEHQLNMIQRIGKIPGLPVLLMQTGIENRSKQAIRLISVTPMLMDFAVEGKSAEWLITALNESVQTTAAAVSLDQIQQGRTVFEYGGFYRKDGVGFFFGPVGTPISYAHASFTPLKQERVAFSYSADMSRVLVNANETRWGQQLSILLEKPQEAIGNWTKWIAATHGARTQQGALTGWNSWQFLGGQVSGKDVLDVVESTKKSHAQLRPAVIQIDGGYEDPSGEKDSNERFSEGLEFYAKQIAMTGARPGILLECASRDGYFIPWQQMANRAQGLMTKGFNYFKLNIQRVNQYYPGNDRQTSFEAIREGYATIRNAVGDNTYLLNNDLKPNRAAVGFVDAHRIGAESKRDMLRPVFDDVLRNFSIQGSWGAVDSDSYFLGTDLENISSINGGWPIVRTWTSIVGLSCGNAITSDPWYLKEFKPLLRNVETMTPPAREHTEVLDLCTSHEYPRLVGHVERDWGRMTVALLWNPGATERKITLDFQEAGLESNRRYAVWSFWDDRFLGVAKDSWTTPSLSPSASQHLRFTDLDATPDRPVLIGSNLHIYCGAAEIERVTSLQGGMEIELNDAGARDGNLFVYSRLPPVLKTATGCTVETIAYAGENVWRIALSKRITGTPQRLEMSIQLPVTKQLWFWLLVALALASLCFATWRYLSSLRLERAYALQKERSRIAQDLHDNIGANLAHIALLSEQVEQSIEHTEETRAQLDRIFQVSRSTAKELDNVVWAVNPANDTLEQFASYVHGYAEDYLSMAGIRFHFSNTETMPHINLSTTLRHHLLMIVKEALHNIVTHSSASLVSMRIDIEQRQLHLEVTDNGRGMPVKKSPIIGNGLSNIKARVEEMGGSCEWITPASGTGLCVSLKVPV